MNAIVPFRRPAVITRLHLPSGRPRHSAARLAEVEARYAPLLASTPASEFALADESTVTLGTPLQDQIEIETAIAMIGAPGDRWFALNLVLGSEILEMGPAKARQAAQALRTAADRLVSLAADAEMLAEIEAGR